MNKGNSYSNPSGKPIQIETTVKPKFNFRYKLLWILLWPIYVFEWITLLGASEELRQKCWDERIWYYKVMIWHEQLA